MVEGGYEMMDYEMMDYEMMSLWVYYFRNYLVILEYNQVIIYELIRKIFPAFQGKYCRL
jgi:hypothetical protein